MPGTRQFELLGTCGKDQGGRTVIVTMTNADPGCRTPPVIDAHQHFWNLEHCSYPWLTRDVSPIYRTFEPDDLVPELLCAGINFTVLVQAADDYRDTRAMLALATACDFIAGVVGWVRLDRPDEAADALEYFLEHPKFKGVRCLRHLDTDESWLLRDETIESLRTLARFNLPFDFVGAAPHHLELVLAIVERVPELNIVIDHLGNPPVEESGWRSWACLLEEAARPANVFVKLSGLGTLAGTPCARGLRPYVEHALTCFGAERVMFGSDWPVALLTCDYQTLWRETKATLDGLLDTEREHVLGRTAMRFYRLDVVPGFEADK